jgi:hypothetical protein
LIKENRLQMYAKLEKHILEARAKALAFEEREEERRHHVCEDPDSFGIPPGIKRLLLFFFIEHRAIFVNHFKPSLILLTAWMRLILSTMVSWYLAITNLSLKHLSSLFQKVRT